MHNALWLALAALVGGCAGGPGGGGGGGNGGDGGSGAPPFTNGVSTLAGAADAGYVDGNRDVGRFANPVNVAYCADGKLYVADFGNGKIRVVGSDGTSSTLFAKEGFARPFGLACASASTLYVTTDDNYQGKHTPGVTGSIWKVDLGARNATELADSVGMPRGIAVLSDGRLALTDYEHHIVELFDPNTKQLTPLAGARDVPGYADGTGSAAKFNSPYGIAQRSDGKLIVADKGNNRLRLVGLDGTVTTLAGSGKSGFADGSMTGAMFAGPQGVAIDQAGAIYVTDLDNYRVRRIQGDTIDTIAGDGNPGYIDDDNRLASELYGIEGVTVKPDGSMVYVSDGDRGDDLPYNRVRQIKMQ